jgi:formylglycine-generating enzyme required for sulfatase activity
LYGCPGQESALADPRFAHPCGLPDFVPIEDGPFWMGDDESPEKDERPRHRVTLDAYELARFPTTNAMYARFIDAGGYEDERWWAAAIADGQWSKEHGFHYGDLPRYWDDPRFNNPSQPVVGVTWYEAVAYCAWLTHEQPVASGQQQVVYRLPTEAEWERAARGRQGWKYPWGNDWQEDHCNSEEAGLGTPSPVGIFSPGAAQGGLEDLVGNVYEWCRDWYSEDYYGRSRETQNPTGPEKGEIRVLRGGSWWSEGASICRCGYRNWSVPRGRDGGRGFRCARASSSVP